jgi:hypothetical protein
VKKKKTPGLIVLLTDFGLKDPYVGILKGVIASKAPEARIIDLSHEVSPQNVAQAAFFLRASTPHFPQGSLFVCVVDPGVGSRRNILWVKTRQHQFLAPDNGVLSWIEDPILESRTVANRRWMNPDISNTFHGRDIFAPVAAQLIQGKPGHLLGPETVKTVSCPWPKTLLISDKIAGEIIFIDRFGNCISNIESSKLRGLRFKREPQIFFRGKNLGPLRRHYAEVLKNRPLCLTSSFGLLELAVREGSFAARFKAQIGEKIECRWN